MENDGSLSLLSHCIECTTSCCSNGMFVTTEENHRDILASGTPDHFYKVSFAFRDRQVTHFINDFRENRTCKYQKENGPCSIEDLKSLTCQTYPVVATIGGYKVIKELAEEQGMAFTVYENRRNIAFMAKHGAIVTPPPRKKLRP